MIIVDHLTTIVLTPEFQQAFKRVTGLGCTEHNVITTMRENPDLFERVREVLHPDIVVLTSQRRRINELKQRLEKHKPNTKQEETEQ